MLSKIKMPIQQNNLYLERYLIPRRSQNDIFVLSQPFKIEWQNDSITVPRGFATDGTSIPNIARAVLDRVTGIEASVVHDFLYRTRKRSKEFADSLFDAMLTENPHVSWLQRRLMVSAVRAFGDQSYYGDSIELIVGQESYND